MKKSYERLEGRYITYIINNKKRSEIPGVVVGCDYDIGISIVRASDKSKYLVCLNGPQSPQVKNYKGPTVELSAYLRKYDAIFQTIVEYIEAGYCDYEGITRIFKCGYGPTAEHCSFL